MRIRLLRSFPFRFHSFPLILLSMFLIMGCSSDDEPRDKTHIIYMWVSSETSYITVWDGQKEECMLVKFSENGEWKPLGMGQIEGFGYQKGYAYKLEVEQTILADPPSDGYDRIYKLVKILEQLWEGEVASDNLQRYYIVGNQGGIVEITFAPRQNEQLFLDFDCAWVRDVAYDITPGKWTLSFKVDPNQGLGRAHAFNLTVGEEHYKVGLWQQPREFAQTEIFSDCTGNLCLLLGCDLENIKRIHNYIFNGELNADDLGWLRAWLLEAWEGPRTKGFLSLDMYNCLLSTSLFSENPKYNLPELPDYYQVKMDGENSLPVKYFKDLQVMKDVRLSEELVAIGESAFDHCLFLESVNLPANLRKIGPNAFSGCTSLTNIVFPFDSNDGTVTSNIYLETIGSNAFMGVGKIMCFIVPESLKSVGRNSLPYYITNLYLISPTPQECLDNIIGPSVEECTVFIPNGCLEAYKSSAKWNKYNIEELSDKCLIETF